MKKTATPRTARHMHMIKKGQGNQVAKRGYVAVRRNGREYSIVTLLQQNPPAYSKVCASRNLTRHRPRPRATTLAKSHCPLRSSSTRSFHKQYIIVNPLRMV